MSLLDDLQAVIFDMDGTLVDSRYDWPAIRAELGIDAPSLIDALNGLDSPQREAKWRLRAPGHPPRRRRRARSRLEVPGRRGIPALPSAGPLRMVS